MQYALLAVLAVSLTIGVLAGLQCRSWRRVETRRVVVNLKSGQAIDGHLIARRGTLLFLRAATLHEPGAAPVPLDGEILIDRSEVDFIQVP